MPAGSGSGKRGTGRAGEKSLTLDIDGRAVPLRLVRNRRARRLILRIDPRAGGATVTLPPWSAWAEGADMAVRETAWIRDRLADLPRHVPFVDGGSLPFLGENHVIRHRPGRGSPVRQADGTIEITGDPAHLARRLTDWLRSRARDEIEPRARAKADSVERRISSVTIRDTRSRWGSCSSQGGLSFSWRLVLAPPAVLDYVVAHEVAHLRHHDHSAQFWAVAATLTDDMDAARAWLRRNGPALHLYG